jgi:AcrR family transcriptional regulator
MSTPIAQTTARGASTREALVAAAIEEFGRSGFEAASTRAIALRAGVNQALIGYHFGSKQGLYLAVFEHIAGRVAARMTPLAAEIGPVLREGGPVERARLLAYLHAVTGAFFALLASEETASWPRLILREQQEPTAAFDLMFERVMGPMLALLNRLVGRLIGRDEDAADTRIVVVTIVGQLLIFRVARAVVLRQLGIA